MVFGRRKRYPLPKFPPNASRNFELMCERLDDTTMLELRNAIEPAYDQLRKASEETSRVDLNLARQLVDISFELLDRYDQFDEEQKALVVGAVRYFIVADDGLPDDAYATGLDDDVQIMNHVLEELGIEGRFIEIP